MGFCLKLNKVVTFLVIIFAGLWFILVVVLPQSLHIRLKNQINLILKDNWKIQSITHPIHFTGIDPQSLELIQLIDNGVPNIFGEEAILVITNQWTQIDYTSLLSSLSSLKLLGDRYRFPIYVLKQKSNHNFYNYRTIMHQARTVQFLINKCIETHNIKRLTLISFEESALMSLLSLSEAQSSLIFKIDKLILINPFNPTHDLYQNDPKSLSRCIKRHILSDRRRLIAFHHLRIIIINTFRTVHPQQPESRDYFNFAFQDQKETIFKLNSTLSLSSKSLFDVNSYIEKGLYFHNKPFINILMRIIIEDQKTKLSIQSIEYILRYREFSQFEPEIQKKKCKILFLQELQSNVEVKSNCYRIVQRQRYKYHQAALVFYSEDKISIFGDNYEKIPSSNYRSKKYYTNVITNLKNINEIILFVETKPIFFFVTIIRSPLNNPFQSIGPHPNQNQDSPLNTQETVLIESCQGWRPVIGLDHNENIKELIEWNLRITVLTRIGSFTIGIQSVISLFSHYFPHMCLVRTLTIVSTRTSLQIYPFYYSFFDMIITSTATLIEIISLGLIKGSQFFNFSKNYYLIFVIMPLLFEICKLSIGFFNLSSIKLLWLQLIFVNHKEGYLISWIKFYFLIDTYATQQPSLYSLILLAVWQISNMPNSPLEFSNNLARVKGKLANILFLLMLCFSLGEQGSVIHQLVNFYMITHLLLGAGQILNRLIQNSQ